MKAIESDIISNAVEHAAYWAVVATSEFRRKGTFSHLATDAQVRTVSHAIAGEQIAVRYLGARVDWEQMADLYGELVFEVVRAGESTFLVAAKRTYGY